MLDADVLIAGERGVFDLEKWFLAHAEEEFEIAAITVAELWHGVERADGAHRRKRQEYLEKMLSVLPVVAYTEHTAIEHARLWAQLESAGTMIGPYDVIVAASALERGSGVATFNRRHFSQVKGLKVVDPAASGKRR